jgi:carbonic anhydrase
VQIVGVSGGEARAGRANAEGQLYGSAGEHGKPSVPCAPGWGPPPARWYNGRMFDDLLAANRLYQEEFHDSGVAGVATKGLGVITCIDTRIDPLAMLGLQPGDAKIIRNAGARVTPDALRSLVLAVNLLGVRRVCLVQHTDCAMTAGSEAEMRARVSEAAGRPADGWEFLSTTDQLGALRQDVQRIRDCELLPPDLVVGAFVFDVRSGELVPADL